MMFREETLRQHGAPVLYSLKHLALSTGVDYGFLRGVIRRNTQAYKAIRIPKNTGGFRDLLSPAPALMQVQRWILHEILSKVPRQINSFAYFAKITPKECVERHAGASWLIKTDLHNYFPSISEKSVYTVFLNMGYSDLVSFELSRICTWVRPGVQLEATESAITDSEIPYPRTPLGYLPQGSPTSGALANACTRQLDNDLSTLALNAHLRYTRYSDDMTFSSRGPLDRARAAEFIGQVRRLVTASGLTLHAKKTKIIPPGARKIVLGMLVTDTGVGILREQRRMVDLHIHAVAKYGPIDYAERRNFDSVLSYINHVEGWLAYLSHIDGDWTSRRRRDWTSALSVHNVSVTSLG